MTRFRSLLVLVLAGLLALLFSVSVLGDKVTGPLIRNYSGDGYATHYSHTGYGGYANITNISDLTSLQLAPGMVVSLASSNNWFLRTFDNSAWVPLYMMTNDVQGFLGSWSNLLAPKAGPTFTGVIASTNLDARIKSTNAVSAAAVYTGRTADYNIDNTGATDAQAAIAYMVSQVAATSGPKRVVFAPGKYLLGLSSSSSNIIFTGSDWSIDAQGATFVLPTTIPTGNSQYPNNRAFVFSDCTNVTWTGGTFTGLMFNQYAYTNPGTTFASLLASAWLPYENPYIISIEASSTGNERLTFNGLTALNTGAINGRGLGSGLTDPSATAGWSTYATTPNRKLRFEMCQLINCGHVEWDYSKLAQILSYPAQYTSNQFQMALQFPLGKIAWGCNATNGSTLIAFDNTTNAIPTSGGSASLATTVAFIGNPPAPFVTGQRYIVLTSTSTGVTVANNLSGSALAATASQNGGFGLIYNFSSTSWDNYSPKNGGGRSGCLTLGYADGVTLIGGRYSSFGDNLGFACVNNLRITGAQLDSSEMGGFVTTGNCNNVTLTGNTLTYIGQGSRILSFEHTRHLTCVGNTFFGGGRGILLIDPYDYLFKDNIFQQNNSRGYADWAVGRIRCSNWTTNSGTSVVGLTTQLFWEQTPFLQLTMTDGSRLAGKVKFVHNQILTDSGHTFSFQLGNSAGPVAGIEITDNAFAGGSRSYWQGNPAVTNAPFAPVIVFNGPVYDVNIARNGALMDAVSGSYSTTISGTVTNITIPHFSSKIFVDYTNSSSYGAGSTLATIYTPTLASSSTFANLYTASADATNLTFTFASPIPTGAQTFDWSVRQTPYTTASTSLSATSNQILADYFKRIIQDGAEINGTDHAAFVALASAFEGIGWSKFIEVWPLYNGILVTNNVHGSGTSWTRNGAAFMEKLVYSTTGQPRLSNAGNSSTQTGGFSGGGFFTGVDYSARGLTADSIKAVATYLSPSSFNSGLTGGISVYPNDAADFSAGGTQWLFGYNSGNTNLYGFSVSGNTLSGYFGGSISAVVAYSGTNSTFNMGHLFTVARSSSTSLTLYQDGVSKATYTTATSIPSAPTVGYHAFTRTADAATGAGYAVQNYPHTLGFAFVDDGTLTAGNYVTLTAAINAWMTSLTQARRP